MENLVAAMIAQATFYKCIGSQDYGRVYAKWDQLDLTEQEAWREVVKAVLAHEAAREA